jgi:hypothetical protein
LIADTLCSEDRQASQGCIGSVQVAAYIHRWCSLLINVLGVPMTKIFFHHAVRKCSLSILLLAASVHLHAAGRVFYDGFESGTVSQWSADASREKCKPVRAAVDGAGPFSESFQAECNWNGVVSWSSSSAYSTLVLKSWAYSREFLIRFRVRLAADVDRKDGQKLLRLYSATSESFFMSARMNVTDGPMFAYWESIGGGGGARTYGDGTKLGDGKWHEVEIYIRHNSPGQLDGATKIWLDGAMLLQAEGITSVVPSGKWYPLYVMSNWSNNPGWEHDADNHAYWDDFEIYSDAGVGATGSMADGTIRDDFPTAEALPVAPSAFAVN